MAVMRELVAVEPIETVERPDPREAFRVLRDLGGCLIGESLIDGQVPECGGRRQGLRPIDCGLAGRQAQVSRELRIGNTTGWFGIQPAPVLEFASQRSVLTFGRVYTKAPGGRGIMRVRDAR